LAADWHVISDLAFQQFIRFSDTSYLVTDPLFKSNPRPNKEANTTTSHRFSTDIATCTVVGANWFPVYALHHLVLPHQERYFSQLSVPKELTLGLLDQFTNRSFELYKQRFSSVTRLLVRVAI